MEHLFVEAVADTMAEPVILKRDNLSAPDGRAAPDHARAMAEALEAITHPGAPTLDGFRIILRHAVDAAPISRKQIAKHHFKTLESTLSGPHARERAALLLSLVTGVQLMRQTLRLPALAQARPATLTALLTPLFEQLWHPDCAAARSEEDHRAVRVEGNGAGLNRREDPPPVVVRTRTPAAPPAVPPAERPSPRAH